MATIDSISIQAERQARLDLLAEATATGLWEWDVGGNRLVVDSTTARQYAVQSLDLADAAGVFARVVYPADLPAFHAAVAAAGTDSLPIGFRFVSADGSLCATDVTLRSGHASSGGPRLVMVTRQIAQMAVSHDNALLRRISLALQAAGVNCWEYSYKDDRFTWFDTLPQDLSVEETNRRIAETIFPEDEVAVRRATEVALEQGADSLASIIRRYDADGNIRHYQLHQRFFRDSEGRPLSAIGASRDITAEIAAAHELQRQTHLLQETQRRLDRAALSIQEGHWELELPTGRHWASKGYLAVLGYPEESQALDTLEKVKAIVNPDDEKLLRVATAEHLAGGPSYDVEVRIRVADGTYRWFRLRASAERDIDGNAIRLSGSIHDIQKQRLAEEALRDVQARFTRAINGTQDGLWEVDVDSAKMWLSPRLNELLGYESGELSDSQHVLRDLAHPDDFLVLDAAIRASYEQGVAIDVETRLRTKSGAHRWYRMRSTPPINYAAQGRRSSGSIQDVTEARAARERLIQASEAAQAANRAKSDFLANVSHEIRTPMNGIIGMTSLLLDTDLDPTQREYSDTIRASANSLLAVINDILDFSKIEAGKLDIEAVDMDLPSTVEEVGGIMSLLAAAKNLELIINVHPDVPEHVLGDPQRIRQCLINLLGNAIKFTRTGEIVCDVSVEALARDCQRIRFDVRDTGIGVAPAALQTLFQPFVQADSSTTRHFGGTGLGLSIVRRLVEMMGGEAGVESTLGVGSRFWFVLPLAPSHSSQAPRERRSARLNRVLVADDNETNRRVLSAQLAHRGFAVTTASGGVQALSLMKAAAAEGQGFEIVIVDFQMPGMDGEMLGRHINEDPALSNARIVLLTSMERQGDLRRFTTMGFAGYLSKPVKPRELFACLDRVLERDSHEWHTRTQPIVTSNAAHQFSDAARFSGRVLLVEDNAVNQRVAQRFLERLGCEVTVAGNGQEGLDAYQRQSFDLILMDVNMPVMDGYTASRYIREAQGSRPRVPIVALTANAMTGQLDLCLASGMDGLLTKPIDVERLEEVLHRGGLATDATTLLEGGAGKWPTAGALHRSALDLTSLSAMIGDDPAFAAELARSYEANSRGLLAELRLGAAGSDLLRLTRAAHQLRGSSANLHTTRLHEMCAELERDAARLNDDDRSGRIAGIAEELDRVCEALTTLGGASPARRVN